MNFSFPRETEIGVATFLGVIDWYCVMNDLIIDKCVDFLNQQLYSTIELYIPKSTYRARSNYPLCYSQNLQLVDRNSITNPISIFKPKLHEASEAC